ncbi:MAG: hypothetical protein Q4D81_13785, partial [Eubacteriales bacterium]|nr:hypothetical protein [Eubacteriales bacterium]
MRNVHRKKRTAGILAVLLALSFCLPGCGLFAPSEVSLAKSAVENAQKAQSAEVTTKIESSVSLKYDALNFGLDLDLDADIDTEMTREPERSKGTIGIEFDLLGSRQSFQGQYYTDVPGDGTKVTYTKIFGDFWTKQTKQIGENGQSEINPLVMGVALLKAMQEKTLTAELQKETTEINGKEAY